MSYHEHRYTYSVGSGTKSDFVPIKIGETAEQTLYKRVEFTYLACQCGQTIKRPVLTEGV